MYQMLKPGEKIITLTTKQIVTIKDLIGEGGQGEVYKAELQNRSIALKWYFRHPFNSEQKRTLSELIKTGAPSHHFIWPQELVFSKEHSEFGYIMEFKDSRFRSITDLMNRYIEPNFSTLLTVGFHLADGFSKLHSLGYCYRDISHNNIFFDPDTGEVKILDNDNVVINNSKISGVSGTPRFMAPEIARGDKDAAPNISTDEFSLAILLFYLLFIHHPLEGKNELKIHSFDAPAMAYLYGINPVFIFDPDNEENRPDPEYHKNAILFWGIYPPYLKGFFIEVFTKGILEERIPASYWKAIMSRTRDLIFYCHNCSAENFYTQDIKDYKKKCWRCEKVLAEPMLIRINQSLVALNNNTELFPHHINKYDLGYTIDEMKPIGQVSTHPENPNIFGLLNISSFDWYIEDNSGIKKTVPPGKNVHIKPGIKIEFENGSIGEII